MNIVNFPLIIERKKDLKPLNGWATLTNTLAKLKDQDVLIGKGGGMDGVTYCFEICDPLNYRFYTYFTPEITQHSNSTSKKVAQILQKVEDEFSFKRLYID
jgi:hypothetical protein